MPESCFPPLSKGARGIFLEKTHNLEFLSRSAEQFSLGQLLLFCLRTVHNLFATLPPLPPKSGVSPPLTRFSPIVSGPLVPYVKAKAENVSARKKIPPAPFKKGGVRIRRLQRSLKPDRSPLHKIFHLPCKKALDKVSRPIISWSTNKIVHTVPPL